MTLQVEDGDILGGRENTLEEAGVDGHRGVSVIVGHQYEGCERREPLFREPPEPGGVGESVLQLEPRDGCSGDQATA